MICDLCKKPSWSGYCIIYDGKSVTVCGECNDKIERDRIDEKLKDVTEACDFKNWKMRDMSEAFWMHLARYKKCPNRKSLQIMNRALLWAVHADHGLSNSFYHALDWVGLNLHKELKREDLPEDLPRSDVK